MSHPDPGSPGGEGPAETSAEQRLAEVVAAYRALQAENDSYRQRVSRNAERRYAQRHERLLLKFIDILDNLDRALDASELGTTGGAMIEGLILVRTQLLQTLQEEGLERIPVMGIPYDPEVAEAVGTRPVDDPDHHHVVVQDVRRGYRLNGKLARAAQVIVGEYPGELPPSEPADPGDEESGRVDVVAQGDESTGELEALAAQAAAAVEGGDPDHGDDAEGLIGAVDLEAAVAEAVGDAAEAGHAADDEAEGVDDGTDLATAAREAAAMAEAGDADVPPFAGDAGEAPVFADDEEAGEDAAVPDAGDEPGPTGGGSERDAAPAEGERRRGRRPQHPLDDVDPSAFEDEDRGPDERG